MSSFKQLSNYASGQQHSGWSVLGLEITSAVASRAAGTVKRRIVSSLLICAFVMASAAGLSSVVRAASSSSSNPSLSASPSSNYPGAKITINGSHLGRNRKVTLRFGRRLAGSFRTNGSGAFSKHWTIPGTAAPGAPTLKATTNVRSASTTISVRSKATPILSWPTPSAVSYGTALSGTQLNATSSVPGVFVYDPAAGTKLPPGDHVLSATFSPTNTTKYGSGSTLSVTLHVSQGTPVIRWPSPAAVSYGTALDGSQLDAIARLPGSSTTISGSFTYNPAPGTVLSAGDHTLAATFTPTDSTDYAQTQATVTEHVNQATPMIAWPKPAGIPNGTALSDTQLDASADVAGVFAYSPASGAVLSQGTHTLTAVFTPTDTTNYATTTTSVTISVGVTQNAPTLSWATPAAVTYGTALSATQLNPSANTDGTFSYSPSLGTVLGAGDHTLTATFTPSDTSAYTSGATAQVVLHVNQATPVITWTAPTAMTYGTALSGTQLDAPRPMRRAPSSTAPVLARYCPPGTTPLQPRLLLRTPPTTSTEHSPP